MRYGLKLNLKDPVQEWKKPLKYQEPIFSNEKYWILQ